MATMATMAQVSHIPQRALVTDVSSSEDDHTSRASTPLPSETTESPESSLPSDVMARFPCKARSMPFSHNKDTAYIDVPVGARHGMLLGCSHAACSGNRTRRRFSYCAVCKIPVSKRNFFNRHAHGIAEKPTLQAQQLSMQRRHNDDETLLHSPQQDDSAPTKGESSKKRPYATLSSTTDTTLVSVTNQDELDDQQGPFAAAMALGNNVLHKRPCTLESRMGQLRPRHVPLSVRKTEMTWLRLFRNRPADIDNDPKSTAEWIGHVHDVAKILSTRIRAEMNHGGTMTSPVGDRDRRHGSGMAKKRTANRKTTPTNKRNDNSTKRTTATTVTTTSMPCSSASSSTTTTSSSCGSTTTEAATTTKSTSLSSQEPFVPTAAKSQALWSTSSSSSSMVPETKSVPEPTRIDQQLCVLEQSFESSLPHDTTTTTTTNSTSLYTQPHRAPTQFCGLVEQERTVPSVSLMCSQPQQQQPSSNSQAMHQSSFANLEVLDQIDFATIFDSV